MTLDIVESIILIIFGGLIGWLIADYQAKKRRKEIIGGKGE